LKLTFLVRQADLLTLNCRKNDAGVQHFGGTFSNAVFLSNFHKTVAALCRKPAALLSIAASILFLNSTYFGRSCFGIGFAQTVKTLMPRDMKEG